VPATTVPETEMPALFQHELRWARTVKSLAPVGFVLSTIQYPLFWAALTVGISGGAPWAWMLFVTAWLVRAIVAIAIDRNLKVASALTIWCLPLRDLLSMTVILASYRTRRVAWRGQIMLATRPGLAPGEG
jgi:ceramide glucosyltransferase